MCVVDFQMIVDINKTLKDKGIEYSVHSIGGCASCGLSLKQEGQSYPIEEIINNINQYLKSSWLTVRLIDSNILVVESLFKK